MPKKILIIALVLYVLSAGGSYAAFNFLGPSGASQTAQMQAGDDSLAGEIEGALLQVDPGEPKDQPCPLNGQMYTSTEQQAWSKKRPLAVMIENTPDARPQSGLSDADVTFEAVAEGGVTRFMPLFYCGVQRFDTTLAPIRSARTYYIDLASGFNWPLYVHVGGANLPGPSNALGQLSDYGWVGENDLNQFSIGYPTFVRDYNRIPGKEIATEHTMVTSTEKLWEIAEERDWTNTAPDRRIARSLTPGSDWQEGYEGWSFEDEPAAKGTTTNIAYDFWSGYNDYAVQWSYDAQADRYNRSQGGEAHTDLNNGKQVSASNVIVMFAEEKGPINEAKHMLYEVVGTGEALIFNHGNVTKATWSKKDREAELQFTDSKGTDLELARGPIWVSVVGTSNEVEY